MYIFTCIVCVQILDLTVGGLLYIYGGRGESEKMNEREREREGERESNIHAFVHAHFPFA